MTPLREVLLGLKLRDASFTNATVYEGVRGLGHPTLVLTGRLVGTRDAEVRELINEYDEKVRLESGLSEAHKSQAETNHFVYLSGKHVLELPLPFWEGGLTEVNLLLQKEFGFRNVETRTYAEVEPTMKPLAEAVAQIKREFGDRLQHARVQVTPQVTQPVTRTLTLAFKNEFGKNVEMDLELDKHWREAFVKKMLRDLGVKVKPQTKD